MISNNSQKVLVALRDGDALLNLGGALGNLKRYEEALAAYEQAIHLDPTDASCLHWQGICAR